MAIILLLIPINVLLSTFLLFCQPQHASGLIIPTQSSPRAFLNLSLLKKSSKVPISTPPLTHYDYDRLYNLSKRSTIPTPSSIEQFKTHSKATALFSSSSESAEGGNNEEGEIAFDPVLSKISRRLRRANWISWWSQVILTVISSIILLFARSVMNAVAGPGSVPTTAPGGFLFAGSGMYLSFSFLNGLWNDL